MRKMEVEFNRMMSHMSNEFASEKGFQMARAYIIGLLGDMERKNGWQMAEYLGAAIPYTIQQFLYHGRFSVDGLRDRLRDYVGEKLGEEDGVFVVDETSFLKQGEKFCGVRTESAAQVRGYPKHRNSRPSRRWHWK